MNKKALIIQIAGGVVVSALMMFIFSSLAGPYLEFLVDAESIKGFNKFTKTVSQTCRDGVGTDIYWGLNTFGREKIYTIGLVGPITAAAIGGDDKSPPYLPVCKGNQDDPDNPTCTTKNSKSRIQKCYGEYCYCLFKIYYEQNYGSGPKHCAPADIDAVVVEAEALINTSAASSDLKEPATMSDPTGGSDAHTQIYSLLRAAQSFEFANVALLTKLQIYGSYNDYQNDIDHGDLIVSILSNDSTGGPNEFAVIAATRVRSHMIGGTAKWIDVDIGNVILDPNTKYFISVASPDTVTQGKRFIWKESPLPTGDGYYDDGGGWATTSHKFAFKVEAKNREVFGNLADWDFALSHELLKNKSQTGDNEFGRISVLQCRTILDDMGCAKNTFPVLPTFLYEDTPPGIVIPKDLIKCMALPLVLYAGPIGAIPLTLLGMGPIKECFSAIEEFVSQFGWDIRDSYGTGFLVWMQPDIKTVEIGKNPASMKIVLPYKRWFDSFSFERGIGSDGAFEPYMSSFPSPEFPPERVKVVKFPSPDLSGKLYTDSCDPVDFDLRVSIR